MFAKSDREIVVLEGRKLRNFFAIDEREEVIAFAQTGLGKAVLVAMALGIMLLPIVIKRLNSPLWSIVVVAIAALHAYLPAYRGLILFASAWLTTLFWLPVVTSYDYASMVLVLLVCWLTLVYVRHFKTHLLARRPLIALLTCLGVMSFCATRIPTGPLREMSWSFVAVFSSYIWYVCYAIVDLRGRKPAPVLTQMGVLKPFWLTSSTPYGKGAAFLLKHLSTTPRELAITQIKAVKLLLWMVVLLLIQSATYRVFIVMLEIPKQVDAIAAYVQGNPYPRWINWCAVTLDTAFFSIYIAVYGHKAIGLARLAGFRLPRNTCRPLESRTLADFWNRYNFYFKEIMVDFFYIPTFLKTGKKYPRLRMFIATFMAAGVGNFIFHFIRDLYEIHTKGAAELAFSYLSYALYCSLLAIGIGISQLRLHAGIKPADTWWGRARSFVVVWGFIVLLQNFDINMRPFSVQDNIAFTASLFGFGY